MFLGKFRDQRCIFVKHICTLHVEFIYWSPINYIVGMLTSSLCVHFYLSITFSNEDGLLFDQEVIIIACLPHHQRNIVSDLKDELDDKDFLGEKSLGCLVMRRV